MTILKYAVDQGAQCNIEFRSKFTIRLNQKTTPRGLG